MTENQTPTPVPLPPPMRYLTQHEDNQIWARVFAGRAHNLEDRLEAEPFAYGALSVLGVFRLPMEPELEMDNELCNAQKLAWDTTQYPDTENIGRWFQCAKGRGHGSTDHRSFGGVADWSDGVPGSAPDPRTA
ncbi:hypothetical protein ACFPOI_50690 [Nonomuraea angiospora]|uniref:Uncharacterized protein n=1 Tax=Nonomuraea angiospora TaxID=46172 RepID=A0ABR9M146_9ACTN|nr:hypothetical protein [Nonomuraea angiospora]MBE1586623.1 hypothetical protein [Nonomuraea angiospora]